MSLGEPRSGAIPEQLAFRRLFSFLFTPFPRLSRHSAVHRRRQRLSLHIGD